ncbi:hypothetical protein DIPPA_56641 [Diplonema papillatum]|nr:hypothetical protein DIPPA_56641 [Diplonema papillatum]
MSLSTYNAKSTSVSQLAPLTYALYGVHTYPNYLTEKFSPLGESEERLTRYISDLQLELGKAEAARAELQKVRALSDLANQWSKWRNSLDSFSFKDVNSSLIEALSGDDDAVRSILTPVGSSAFLVPVLKPDFCRHVLEEAAAFRNFKHEHSRQSAVGALDEWGTHGKHVADVLFNFVMKPLAALLFPKEGRSLNFRYAFVAAYNSVSDGDLRTALNLHTDDSEVTMTIQLGGQWKGGDVVFSHLRGHPQEGQHEVTVHHETPGVALLHIGQHLHEVAPLLSGNRSVLVIWGRSGEYRSSHCPCCARFRRDRCLFSPTWQSPSHV